MIMVALPLHAARLAEMWLTTRGRVYQQTLELKAEVDRYAGFLAQLEASEEQLAGGLINLHTREAQRQAVLGHQASVQRLRQEFAANASTVS